MANLAYSPRTTTLHPARPQRYWLLSLGALSLPAWTLDTASLAQSAISPACLDYKLIGLCFWLSCTPFSCEIETSIRVQHFNPDLVVSSYAATGENPWTEMAALSAPLPGAEGGGNLITPSIRRDNLPRFKNVDAIGHPGGFVAAQLAAASGLVCAGGATALQPYFLSTLDTLAWRHAIPESLYPEALTPGLREVGSQFAGEMWGNVYPRHGFLVQPDDFKAAAMMAQRAADLVTRNGQPHVYLPLTPAARAGYWPPPPVLENDPATHHWQPLVPEVQDSCAVFPTETVQAEDGAYAWALWRPYSCCERKGQVLLSTVAF
jgi:integrating conjugative element protein (TIGR03756 family)